MVLPLLRIVYLPFRAMAEPTRMLLALGDVSYQDEAVWGTVFQHYKQTRLFPFDKTPVMIAAPECDEAADTISMAQKGMVLAQSGSLARYAAKMASRYPIDNPVQCAVADGIFELGQELCTINPLVNCFVGDHFEHVKRHYFKDVMPVALPQLERQLSTVGAGLEVSHYERGGSDADADGGVFFAGTRATYGDVNIFHMLNNAMLLEEDLLVHTPTLEEWYWRMASLPGLKEFLETRPELNGIGEDPGLEDRNGVRVTQRTTLGQGWLKDGCWHLKGL